ncbi:PREDICTED: anoctamin-1-like isoform X2 [Priapulus caudatus]|nr:PREDICTED: anoctamin-1-like isoform X2 [Priapulus caudatus]
MRAVDPSESEVIELHDVDNQPDEQELLAAGTTSDSQDITPNNGHKSLFFEDGRRRIDFMLCYKPAEDSSMDMRRIYERNLREEGLELEYDHKGLPGVDFVKIHAPWEVLSRYAEIMKLRGPMKEVKREYIEDEVDALFPNQAPETVAEASYWYNQVTAYVTAMFSALLSVFLLDPVAVPTCEKKFTCVYSRDKEYLFGIPENKGDFFSPSQRSLIVDFILRRKKFSDEPDNLFAIGLEKLLSDEVYYAGYPLHEGGFRCVDSPNTRKMFYEQWAAYKKVHKYQPIHHIRNYFGEKIALYFAWVGFYTFMLVPAAIVGVICFIYGLVTMGTDTPSKEICNADYNITMCPLCNQLCDYWNLYETCNHARASHMFDNGATVFFAVFMALWGTIFLELWKRYMAKITYEWDLIEWEHLEEHPRPEFVAKLAASRRKRLNFVTQILEPYIPFWSGKVPRYVFSLSMVLFLIALAMGAVIGVIVYRISVLAAFAFSKDFLLRKNATLITAVSAATINLICIMLLNMVYGKVAHYLTRMEMLRTQSEFDDSLTLKLVLLQFVNYFSSIFYIAFIKGRLAGYPGDPAKILSFRQEECEPGGCLIELCIQLAIIMLGKQFIMNNSIEIALPRIMRFVRRIMFKGDVDDEARQKQWVRDFRLIDMGPNGLFPEYLELLLQFGFLTVFVAAFPLAPLFALINNILEVRIDADKMVTQYRRPIATRAKDIGVWFNLLDAVAKLALICNAFVIAFTSDFIPRLVYTITQSPDGGLTGYVVYSLSEFDTADFANSSAPDNPLSLGYPVSICRYKDYRYPPTSDKPYRHTEHHWHVFAARLAFVVVFENVVVAVTILIRWLIPDIPQDVLEKMRREKYIRNHVVMEKELQRAKDNAVGTPTKRHTFVAVS